MQQLLNEAIQHRAVQHPYLKALANGSFNNMHAVLKDFASQYGFYSAWFPRYLSSVISKLESPSHRNHLLANLSEEAGLIEEDDLLAIRSLGISDEWVQGIAHPTLFERFQEAMGVTNTNKIGIEVSIWRESFLSLTQHSSAISSVGAIGLGTESIVKYLYKDIISAIEQHTSLSLEEYVFFPLHTEVDDEHGLILLEIAREMASSSPEAYLELRKGMLKSLNLRASFWDDLYARALILDNKTNTYVQ